MHVIIPYLILKFNCWWKIILSRYTTISTYLTEIECFYSQQDDSSDEDKADEDNEDESNEADDDFALPDDEMKHGRYLSQEFLYFITYFQEPQTNKK